MAACSGVRSQAMLGLTMTTSEREIKRWIPPSSCSPLNESAWKIAAERGEIRRGWIARDGMVAADNGKQPLGGTNATGGQPIARGGSACAETGEP